MEKEYTFFSIAQAEGLAKDSLKTPGLMLILCKLYLIQTNKQKPTLATRHLQTICLATQQMLQFANAIAINK